MKTWQKIIAILIAILLIIGYFAFDSFYIAPQRIVTRRVSLSDERIPEQLDEVQILFFADLDYGTFVDEKRLSSLIDRINGLAVDCVIFGGDIYDTDALPNENDNELISRYLKQIRAPLGKFAVLGDSDTRDEETANAMVTLLNNGDFEVLRNRSINIHNGGSQSITLVGLENGLAGFNAEEAYSSVSHSSYVISVCHTPDSALNVPADLTDYFLAAHSHGGQVWYLFGTLYDQPMAEHFQRGKAMVADSFMIDVSSGFGTRQMDVRFLTNSEVAVYSLHNKVIAPEPTQLDTVPAPEGESEEQPANEPPADEESDTFSEAYSESETYDTSGSEEAPAEAPAEEAPAEETPAEQPAEETPAEEAPAEEPAE